MSDPQRDITGHVRIGLRQRLRRYLGGRLGGRLWRGAIATVLSGGSALAALALVPAAPVSVAQSPTNPPIVRVGLYQNQPKVFLTENGDPAGFWVDLLNHIAAQEGWRLDYQFCEWDQCLDQVEQQQLDLMVDVAYSEERDRRFAFNQDVVMASWSVFYTRPGTIFNSILDLDQKRVAVLKNSIQYANLQQQVRALDLNLQFIEVDDFEAVFHHLDQGEADVGVVNYLFGQQNEPQYRVAKTTVVVQPSRLHFVAPEGQDHVLLDDIDRHLAALKNDASSVYYQMQAQWLAPPPPSLWQQARRPLLGALVCLPILAVAGLVLYNYHLRKEITQRQQVETRLRESEQRFQNMAANVPGAIFKYVLHPDGTDQVVYMSPGCYGLWEVDAKAVMQDATVLWGMVHPDDLPAMYESVMVSAQTLRPWYQQWRITTPSGKAKWLEAAGQPEKRENGDVVWDSLILDVSDRKHTESALQVSQDRLRLVTENMSDLVCLHHADGRYLYVTPSSYPLLGYRPDELLGRDPYELFHPDDRHYVRRVAHQPALDQIPVPVTYRMRHKNGDYIWLESLTQCILDDSGQIKHLQTTSRNVSDRIKAEQQLKHDALHDSLTQLPNRALLTERLYLALRQTKRDREKQFAVLFLDLDNFKVINDSLGHLVGDQLLLAITAKIAMLVRETDLVARLGGDEFVLLLEGIAGASDAIWVAERLLEELRSPISLGDRDVFASASIGIVLSSSQYDDPQALLRDADLAMYRAKHNGRGQYAIFDPTLHLRAMQRLQLENDLRRALDEEQFVLYYQPIVNLKTSVIQGFEALIRWQHPSRGLVSPLEFIPIAEETGLIVEMGRWILRAACQQLATWLAEFPHYPLSVSVNLSVQQLDMALVEDLDMILATYAVPGHALVLEITESMLVKNVEATCAILDQLRSRGMRISIDDFGTGYSSLSYLHRLPVDALKIDRAFVSPPKADARNHLIAESVMVLSNLLELKAIAEGIETEEHVQWLQLLGCELGQGYFFSRPLPAADITSHLRQQVTGPQGIGTHHSSDSSTAGVIKIT